MPTIAMILIWIGAIICVICTAFLVYIDCTHKVPFSLTRDFYIGCMYIGCVFMVLSILFEFSQTTVFNSEIWLVNTLLWDKMD